jgi:hypothetical protein
LRAVLWASSVSFWNASSSGVAVCGADAAAAGAEAACCGDGAAAAVGAPPEEFGESELPPPHAVSNTPTARHSMPFANDFPEFVCMKLPFC